MGQRRTETPVLTCQPSYDGVFHLLVLGESSECIQFLKVAEEFFDKEKPHIKFKFHMADHLSPNMVAILQRQDLSISCIVMLMNPTLPHYVRSNLLNIECLDTLFFSYGRVFLIQVKTPDKPDLHFKESIQRFSLLYNLEIYYSRFSIAASISFATRAVLKLGLMSASFESGILPRNHRTAELQLEKTDMTRMVTPHPFTEDDET